MHPSRLQASPVTGVTKAGVREALARQSSRGEGVSPQSISPRTSRSHQAPLWLGSGTVPAVSHQCCLPARLGGDVAVPSSGKAGSGDTGRGGGHRPLPCLCPRLRFTAPSSASMGASSPCVKLPKKRKSLEGLWVLLSSCFASCLRGQRWAQQSRSVQRPRAEGWEGAG